MSLPKINPTSTSSWNKLAQLAKDPKTLQKYFGEELETSAIKANAKIGGAAYNKAVGGDPQMIKWWTATRMGWTEKQKHEITGEDGNPLEQVTTIKLVGPNDD